MFHKPGISVCIAAAALAVPMLLPAPARCADVIFRQSVTTELRYDTNATIRPEDEEQSGDTVLLISPDFQLSTERRGFTLSAAYAPNASVYFDNSELNNISHHMTAAMGVSLSTRWSFSAADVFTYSEEVLDTSQIGIQTDRANVWSNTVNLGTAYTLTDKTSVSLGLSDGILRSNEPGFVESRADSASLGLGYAATVNTMLNASYGISNHHFDSPTGSRDVQSQSASVGLSHQFPYSLEVSLSGGASYTPSVSDKYDWIASIAVAKTFQDSSVNFEYVRSITNTSGLTDQLNINERYSASIDYTVSPSVGITVFGGYYQSESIPVAIVQVNSYTAGITGGWRLNSWMSLEAGYSHFAQTSDGSVGDDFRRDHFFVSMEITTYEGKI